ncbi:zinc finger protein 708-like [Culex pipiens pallens]|uniref:zinc finger protein 708-like n=1 Tax=Culex pipiens pallens TaxID=42434 RepID=UPI001954C002|nr:zinc finger protein 708-like [Culex pipiens pallens]
MEEVMEDLCRMCSEKKSRLRSIFWEFEEENLLGIITKVLRLEIAEGDGLPSKVCKPCATALFKINESIVKFREVDKSLRKRLLSGAKKEVEAEGPETARGGTDAAADVLADVGAFFVEVKMEPDQIKSSDESEEEDAPDDDPSYDPEDEDSEKPLVPPKVPKKYKDQSFKDEPVTSDKGSDTDDLPYSKRPPKRKRRNTNPRLPKLYDHKCYICKSESQGSAKALLEHLTVHMDQIPYTCTECVMDTVVLKHVKALNIHKKMHAQPVKCQYCDRRYSNAVGRELHVKTYHLGENAPCPSPCEKCGKICKSIAALKSHLRDHKFEVKCPVCDKIFHRNDRLRLHISQVHEKAEKHECKLCGHFVSTLEAYNIHLNKHKNSETHACDLCPKKFFTAGNLRSHKKVHAKNPNYKAKKDWTSHYTVTELPEGGKSYSCNHCPKIFTGIINTVISHVKTHFKEIKCDQCNLLFSEEHKLKLHYVVHTRERNYKCPHCSKDFMYHSHMSHHIKSAHLSEAELAERVALGYAAKAAKAVKAFGKEK